MKLNESSALEALREQAAGSIDGGQRPRDAAADLGVSEGEVLAALAGDPDHRLRVTPLRGAWKDLLQSLGACGDLLAGTRNDIAICEQVGQYRQVRQRGRSALARGGGIHLRLFLDRWHAAFAVRDQADPDAIRLQFFDRQGSEVHQVRAWHGTDRGALQRVVARFASPLLAAPFLRGLPAQAWRDLPSAAQRIAWRAAPLALCELLRSASKAGLRVAVTVGSMGCLQLHSGPVRHLQPLQVKRASWLHVLDEGFNLHLREDRIGELRVVETDTPLGSVASVQAFSVDGERVVTITGERSRGGSVGGWRRLLEEWRAEFGGAPVGLAGGMA